jgi:hypothetical protein
MISTTLRIRPSDVYKVNVWEGKKVLIVLAPAEVAI